MNCTDFAQKEVAEQYLSGQLSEEMREAYESHYFQCEDCFAELEAMRVIRAGLEELGPGRQSRRTPLRWILAVAAAACLSVFLWRSSSREAPAVLPVERPVLTAQVAPPPYQNATLRGTQSAEKVAFRDAMRGYSKGDFAGTASALRIVLEKYPDALEARYFLAICRLYSDPHSDVAHELESIANSNSTYSEEARFYLGYSLLRSSQLQAARRELEAVIAQHGDYEGKARELLATRR
ncbi:hypothetical protein [Bryobacter aggregatus]|uniref:hypothetical protein n=1 Tax=Bryobacter aggregatus TaxID=360054 RepID=UPI0004E161A0|nr:hypothetical protein [Bryobacter aggregatus]